MHYDISIDIPPQSSSFSYTTRHIIINRSNELDYGLAGIRLHMCDKDYMTVKLLLPVPISKIILNILTKHSCLM